MRYARPMRPAPDEILLEITRLGSVQRVSAIDPASLVEVVFQAPLSADHRSIELLATEVLPRVRDLTTPTTTPEPTTIEGAHL